METGFGSKLELNFFVEEPQEVSYSGMEVAVGIAREPEKLEGHVVVGVGGGILKKVVLLWDENVVEW